MSRRRTPEPPPPYGTAPGVSEEAPAGLGRRIARWIRAWGAGLLVLVGIVVGVAQTGDASLRDAAVGVALVVALVGVAVLIGRGFWLLRERGALWWGRLLSVVVTAGSVWALVEAIRFDNASRDPNGQSSLLAQLLLLAPVAPLMGGLAGLKMTWLPPREPQDDSDEPPISAVALREGEPHRVLNVQSAAVSMALCEDGSVLVLGPSMTGRALVQAWDVQGGTQLWERRSSRGSASVIAVNGRASLVAAMDRWWGLQLFGLKDGTERGRIRRSSNAQAVAFSPAGDCLALSRAAFDGENGSLRIYLLGASAPPRRLGTLRGETTVLAFSMDGAVIASGGGKGHIEIWDARTLIRRLVLRHGRRLVSLAFGPDGRTLASGADDGTCRLWDLASGSQITAFPHGTGVVRCGLDPSGRFLVTTGDDSVLIWDVALRQPHLRLPHRERIVGLACANGSPTFAVSSGSQIYIWPWPQPSSQPEV